MLFRSFINDIINARLSRDLNDYRGFAPDSEFFGEGLASPNWGGRITIREIGDGASMTSVQS